MYKGKYRRGGKTGPRTKTNFKTRAENPYIFPVIYNKDGTVSTHKMMYGSVDGKQIAYPSIVQGKDGNLYDLSRIPGDPVNYAMSTGEYKTFESEAAAAEYASGGYKRPEFKKKYDIGGSIVSGVSYGAGIGATVGSVIPGIGTGIGGVVGGVLGGAYGWIDGAADEKKDAIRKRDLAVNMEQSKTHRGYNPYVSPNAFPFGGTVGAEVEKEEVVQTPDGVALFDGPSHEDGGIDISVQEGSRVFSDRLKPAGSKSTYARIAARESRKLKAAEKMAAKNPDTISRNTVDIMFDNLQATLDGLFNEQESQKELEPSAGKYPDGGPIRRPLTAEEQAILDEESAIWTGYTTPSRDELDTFHNKPANHTKTDWDRIVEKKARRDEARERDRLNPKGLMLPEPGSIYGGGSGGGSASSAQTPKSKDTTTVPPSGGISGNEGYRVPRERFSVDDAIQALPTLYNSYVGLFGEADYVNPGKYFLDNPARPETQVTGVSKVVPYYRAAMRNANPYTQHIVANAAAGAVSSAADADRAFNIEQWNKYLAGVGQVDAANKGMALNLATTYNPQAQAALDAHTVAATEGASKLSFMQEKELNQVIADKGKIDALMNMFPNVTITDKGIAYVYEGSKKRRLTNEEFYEMYKSSGIE